MVNGKLRILAALKAIWRKLADLDHTQLTRQPVGEAWANQENR